MTVGPGDSHAGITVPEGNPGELRELAQTFDGLSGAMGRSAATFGALPGDLSSWQGSASANFALAAFQSRSAADQAAQGFGLKARAARDLADDLQDAQRDAEEAIEGARDAEDRIRRAKELIQGAQQKREAALAKAAIARFQIAGATLTGDIPMAAYAAEAEAGREAEAAAADEERGRRQLEDARDDLDRARERGKRAETRADDAGSRAQGLFVSTAPVPALMPLGGPATGIGGTPSSPLAGFAPLLPVGRLAAGYASSEPIPFPPLLPLDQDFAGLALASGGAGAAQYGRAAATNARRLRQAHLRSLRGAGPMILADLHLSPSARAQTRAQIKQHADQAAKAQESRRGASAVKQGGKQLGLFGDALQAKERHDEGMPVAKKRCGHHHRCRGGQRRGGCRGHALCTRRPRGSRPVWRRGGSSGR